jgi:hypothetical protein
MNYLFISLMEKNPSALDYFPGCPIFKAIPWEALADGE